MASMKTDRALVKEIAVIAGELEYFLRSHEKDFHNGERCQDERVNSIAFLCHRIGVGTHDLAQIMSRVVEYKHYHDEKVKGGDMG